MAVVPLSPVVASLPSAAVPRAFVDAVSLPPELEVLKTVAVSAFGSPCSKSGPLRLDAVPVGGVST